MEQLNLKNRTYSVGQKVIVDGKAMNTYGRCNLKGTIEKFEERPDYPDPIWVHIKIKKSDELNKLKGISMCSKDLYNYVRGQS